MTKKTFLKRLISLSLAFCFTLESSAAAIPPLDTLNGQTNLESTQISAIANPETSHPVAEREKDISVRSLDELLSSDAVTIDTADHATIVNTNIDNFTSEEILKLLGINVQFISAKGNPSLKKTGLSETEFEHAAELHGNRNLLVRELISLNQGIQYDGLSSEQQDNIRQLICSGYTYHQAKAALVTAEMTGYSIDFLCHAKENELSNTQSFDSIDTTTKTKHQKLATKLGVPCSVVDSYMASSQITDNEIHTDFERIAQNTYKRHLGNYDTQINTSTSDILTSTTSTASTSARLKYAPESILENPYNYQNFGDLKISAATGNFRYSETDLYIPGVNGLDLNIVRYYDSAYAYIGVPLGFYPDKTSLANSATILLSYEMYVSYDNEEYYLVSNPEDYDIWDNELSALVESATGTYTTANYDAAVTNREILLSETTGLIAAATDPDGDTCAVKLYPTIQGIGSFDDAFANEVEAYNYTVNEYGLGHGWRLGFSAIETYTAGWEGSESDPLEYQKRLVLSDGRVFNIKNNKIVSELDDMTLTKTSTGYKLTYADGKTESFDSNGRNTAIADRFGNTITLEYTTDSSGDVVSQIKITDTLGNIVIYKEETLADDDTGRIPNVGYYTNIYTLSLNGDVVRTYYSYHDWYDDTLNCVDLTAVKDENGHYTRYFADYITKDFNCFVSSASTNDCESIVLALSLVEYPNGTQLEISSSSTDAILGAAGYHTPNTLVQYKYLSAENVGNLVRDRYALNVGDYSGYLPDYYITDNGTYSSGDLIYHAKGFSNGSTLVWKSSETTYLFNEENELNQKNQIAYDALNEDEVLSSSATNFGSTLLGTAFTTTYDYNSAHLPTKITTKAYEPGNSSEFQSTVYNYTYDAKGNITKETRPNGQSITYTYDSSYNIPLTKTYNQNCNTTITETNTLTVDKKAIASSVVKSNGTTVAQTTYSYDAYGRPTAINNYTSAAEYTTQILSYGAAAQATQIKVEGVQTADGTTAEGTPGFSGGTLVEKTTYNSRGLPTSYTDANGNVTTITYDSASRITQVLYPNGGKDRYVYDIANNTVTYTDVLDNVYTYSYGPFGELEEIYDETAQQALVSYSYDSLGQLQLETVHSTNSALDQMTYYHYDSMGRLVETGIRNSDGSNTALETYTYNAAIGKTTHTVIGSGNAPSQIDTSYTDNMGNMIIRGRMYNNAEYADTYSYDYLGNCAEYISAYMASMGDDYSTRYTYDHRGNVLTETDPLGNEKSYTYDWLGNLLQTEDAKGNITVNTVDDLGRLVKVSTPIDSSRNNVVKYYYDGAGNVVKQQTSTGTAHTSGVPTNYDTTEYIYDNMNRLTEVDMTVSSAIKDFTTYTYDLAGNITRMAAGGRKNGTSITVDPSATTYTYDRFGNVLSETDAMNKTERYTYDLNGAILTRTDRNNVQTQYAYDNRGRLTTETTGTGSGQLMHSYTYALNNALLSESRGGSTITYTYDALGRLTQEYTSPFYKNYTYNIGDLRASFKLKKSNSVQINNTYTYDVLGRLTSVADSRSAVSAEYSYDANSNPVSAEFSSGVTETYSYNSGNLVTAVGAAKGSTPLSQFQYTYDLAGRQSSMTTLSGDVATYTYDTKGQLINDMRTGNRSYSKAYTYDPRGNRVSLTDSGIATAYTYNTANQLLNSTKSSITTAYTYDGNGNTLTETAGSSGAAAYTYDVDNQLTGISGEDLTASYTYYPNGLRKTKTVDDVTTTYVWDGDQLVYESGSSTYKYIRGLTLIASVLGSTDTYYLHDAHGNVVALTNASGTVTRTYEYDAFGNQLNIDPADKNPFRYCGEYYDAETGNYYLRARYYDSSIGRFTQEDPHWNTGNMVYGDDPVAMSRGLIDLDVKYYLPSIIAMRQSWNLYTYCINDPIGRTDPNGLWTVAVGGEASLALLIKLGISGQIVVDGYGNIGLAGTGIAGGGTPAAGIIGGVAVTNADTIYDLNGVGFSTGMSWGIGADVTGGTALDGSAVIGGQFSFFGVSSPFPEGHGELTATGIISLNWLPRWIKDWIIKYANDLYNDLELSN